MALHRSLLERARTILNSHYEELPEEEQDRWLNEFRRQTQILTWLTEQQPDNE